MLLSFTIYFRGVSFKDGRLEDRAIRHSRSSPLPAKVQTEQTVHLAMLRTQKKGYVVLKTQRERYMALKTQRDGCTALRTQREGYTVLRTESEGCMAPRSERERGTLGPDREGYIQPVSVHEAGWQLSQWMISLRLNKSKLLTIQSFEISHTSQGAAGP